MKTVPLKYLARITLGKMLQASGPREGQEVRPYLKSLSVTETGLDTSNLPEMPFSASEQKNLDLRRGDVVVVEGGSIGRSAYLDQDLRGIHFQNSINRVRPNREVDGRFINYCIIDKRSSGYFEAITNQATIRHLTAEKLARTPIPLCGSNEQRLIADYLDRETAEIDAFIADLNDYSALLSQRLEVERDLAFLSLARSSDSVPLKRWLEIPLSYGATESADHYDPNEVRYLRITDFGTDGDLRPETATSLPYEAAAGYMTAPGDILLARSGATAGKAFIVPDSLPEACFAGYLIRARFKDRREAGFVWHALQTTNYKCWILANATVATIQNVSAQKFGTYPIPRPSQTVQGEVIEELDRAQRNINASQALAAKAKTLAEERRAALISAAVTGQIDVRAQNVPVVEQLRDELEVHV